MCPYIVWNLPKLLDPYFSTEAHGWSRIVRHPSLVEAGAPGARPFCGVSGITQKTGAIKWGSNGNKMGDHWDILLFFFPFYIFFLNHGTTWSLFEIVVSRGKYPKLSDKLSKTIRQTIQNWHFVRVVNFVIWFIHINDMSRP